MEYQPKGIKSLNVIVLGVSNLFGKLLLSTLLIYKISRSSLRRRECQILVSIYSVCFTGLMEIYLVSSMNDRVVVNCEK